MRRIVLGMTLNAMAMLPRSKKQLPLKRTLMPSLEMG